MLWSNSPGVGLFLLMTKQSSPWAGLTVLGVSPIFILGLLVGIEFVVVLVSG